MQYVDIMKSHNMYDAMMLLAARCREKDLEIADLRVKLGEISKPKDEVKPKAKKGK